MRNFVWLSLVCVFVQVAVAQISDPIFLNNELVSRNTRLRNTLPTDWPKNNCLADGRCFAIIQFDRVLDENEKAGLQAYGITLHQYIPTFAYLASYAGPANLSLPNTVQQLIPLEAHHKRPNGPISSSGADEAMVEYELAAIPFPGGSLLELAQNLAQRGARVEKVTKQFVLYRVAAEYLPEVLASPMLQYTEAAPTAPQAEGYIGRSSSRIPTFHPGSGLGYTGEGIAIAIGDDGAVHHLDFHGRLVDNTQYNSGTHAEMTTGMAAGAGNIDPSTAGSARGATIHLYDISSYDHLDNAPQHFDNLGIAITSTSFGEGCGEVYEFHTSQIDGQVYNNPELAHVFSAGNHGADPCYNTYSWLGPNADGNYYATITGGRKAGKNVIAVGNVEWNDQLLASSSRGPTPDGRIKPDLSALGQFDRTTGPDNTYRYSSGTSAAAPNVAGALALLYEQYRETHAGAYPSSALIKAMALNTADDLGPAGPDFHYGWGRMNTGRALNALSENQYFTGTIQQGQQQEFQINVPFGAQQLKVMLYWHDPAGSVLSSQALVNDLELRLQGPNGQVMLPWVPSSVPNLDSLQRDALPGEDHINNVEQVVVPQYASGNYQIQINGFQVPEGPQTYFVVYTYELAAMQMLSPQSGTTYLPGESALLTWNAIDTGEPFSLEYSLNGGGSWASLATDIPSDSRCYQWQVPSSITDQLQVRLRRSGQVSTTGQNAVISAAPVFTVDYQDSQTALIEWEPIEGASAYQIYALGERFMEIIATTSATQYGMPAVVGEEYWLSVAPVFPSGRAGRRALAQYYEHFGCESNVTLALQFDRYPAETAWYILGSDGSIRASGGPYGGQAAFSYQEEVICLPPGCFTLVVTDAYNDGMCCNNGDGWYNLTDAAGNILASGGEFGSISYSVFCLEPGTTPPLVVNANVLTEISCVSGTNGVAQALVSGGSGNYTYNWSNGANEQTVAGLGAGTYQVTVSDGVETATASVTLVAPSSIQIVSYATPASCNDGSISLNIAGGTPPYTVSWADGSSDWNRTNLAAGSYFLLVTDANGCQLTHSAQVEQVSPLQLSVQSTMPSCTNPQGGSITVFAQGASGNYTYQWSTGASGTSVQNGLSAGTYEVTVTSGSCIATETIILSSPAGMQVSEASADPRCSDSADGWIALGISGGVPPYTYSWADGATGAHRFNLEGGVYLVTITDAMGCNLIRGFPLDSPEALQVSVEVQHVNDQQNGSISLTIAGGTAPYIVSWSNGAQGATIEELLPGQYLAVVADANGCSISTTVTVDDNTSTETDPVYCIAQGASTNYEWIEAITLNGSHYTSGNDGGLGDYVSLILPMVPGLPQILELQPGYTSTPYNEHWKVWIDYNQDGDFADESEEVAIAGPVTGNVSVTFLPPAHLTGQTRMRIAMKYGSSPTLCTNPSYGEVEDYTIEWQAGDNANDGTMGLQMAPTSSTVSSAPVWRVFPNPVHDVTQLSGWSKVEQAAELLLMNQQGQILYRQELMLWEGNNQFPLELAAAPAGIYQLLLITKEETKQLRLIKQ